jgi:iron complex transport system substrate-binding protein
MIETLRVLSDLSGQGDAFERRFELYLANVGRTREFIGNPEEISVALTFTFAGGDTLSAYRTGMGGITLVFEDLGFQQIELVEVIADSRVALSPELIEQLDADFIFGFYITTIQARKRSSRLMKILLRGSVRLSLRAATTRLSCFPALRSAAR